RSADPVSILRPSGEKAIAATFPVCSDRVRSGLAVEASQTRAVLSKLPVTRYRPSGLNATASTLSVCPDRLAINAPVVKSQRSTVLSHEADASRVASGLNAAALIIPEFGRFKLISSFPVARSQIRINPSMLIVIICPPLGSKAAAVIDLPVSVSELSL